MPVPPATNSTRCCSNASGIVNVPSGPSTSTMAPGLAQASASAPARARALGFARALVAIRAAGCRREQRLVGSAVAREHGRARAHHHRNAQIGPDLQLEVIDSLLQLDALVLGLIGSAAREHDDELV